MICTLLSPTPKQRNKHQENKKHGWHMKSAKLSEIEERIGWSVIGRMELLLTKNYHNSHQEHGNAKEQII